MTHFTVVGFCLDSELDDLMAQYSEEIDVPEYKHHVLTVEDMYRFIDYYAEEVKCNLKKAGEELIRDLTFRELYEQKGNNWNDNVWKKDENGDWAEYSTYNPDAKYDYYSIIKVVPKEYELDFIPFAFVDKNGWHEKGRMGWWAINWDEMPDAEWKAIYEAARDEWEGKEILLIDCHI